MIAPALTRRSVVLGLALTTAAKLEAAPASATNRLRAIEREAGGRLGVVILDAKGRRVAAYREDTRFMFCSTFKLFLAGAVLAKVDRGVEQLDRRVAVTPGDIIHHSPALTANLAAGWMTVEQLCAASVVPSDNGAANLLLDTVGGPAGLTRFFHSLGGRGARLDRREPELNRRHGDSDTTTPAATAAMLQRLLASNTLSAASRDRLEAWMIESPTGRRRLRAGLPSGWTAGDKTGSGADGETNDIAFVDVPGRGRRFIAAYYEAPGRPLADREAVLAQVARFVDTPAGID